MIFTPDDKLDVRLDFAYKEHRGLIKMYKEATQHVEHLLKRVDILKVFVVLLHTIEICRAEAYRTKELISRFTG